MHTSDFNYNLPQEKIAQFPVYPRDSSKLLIYRNDKIEHDIFRNIDHYLPGQSNMYFNNTKVIPARLLFQRVTGAVIEIFLLEPLGHTMRDALDTKGNVRWKCAIGNLKKWTAEILTIHGTCKLNAELVDRKKSIVEFTWPTVTPFSDILQQAGRTPLPPYINRTPTISDQDTYQTIYSQNQGAVAAPTAGLHFTSHVFKSLTSTNISQEYLTLHVSAGTFLPIKTQNVDEHIMHNEVISVPLTTLKKMLQSNAHFAVGTTSLRTMESLYWYGVKLLQGNTDFTILQNCWKDKHDTPTKIEALQKVVDFMERNNMQTLHGRTALYIRPGYTFRTITGLLTNFHQPNSTLLLLIAALTSNWKEIYSNALNNNYRFLSYGDSSLLFL